ncbi:MAG: 4-hydroxybenzoate octaprenyltransferase [Betaproteobacteria bacterium]|nr:4-hydroxybenzoate octaprenyltransferase [Betaproteobacteria bacterium]MDH3435647.1 4-hydroxybenzoate octaprenyltransferase [Betaproteobacteria bacterium]
MIATVKRRLDAYERLIRLDKPIGALLLLWPALWGLWLAAYGIPDYDNLAIFIVGVVLMRSFGCIVNDYADRNFDPHVERTRDRPLATGEVSPLEALALAAFLLLLAFLLVLQLNRLTVMLAFIALPLAAVYPFLKRVFSFPQAWLGIAFGFSIPMAFAAQHGSLMKVAWVLMIANVFWAIAYDTEYAMVDRDDDVKLGLKSSAILLGRHDVAGVMIAHALFLIVMVGVGYERQLGAMYFAGLVVAAGLVGYQYRLIRERNREACFRAFLNNNWVGLAIFAGLALDLYVRVRMRL